MSFNPKLLTPDDLDEDEPKRIPTQEELYSIETKRLHQAGIDLVKYKAALKDLVRAIRVTDALVGQTSQISIHWMCYDVLGNWLRAESKHGPRILRWPWGNWWEVRSVYFNPETQQTETTIHRLVIK